MPLDISIIIPVYNEQAVINATLAHLAALPGPAPREVIVVDGHPQASTLPDIEGKWAVRRLTAAAGRGRQMNRGASAATGAVLLFLHADTLLPPGALAMIAALLADGRLAAGAFDLDIDSPRRALKAIARTASLRSRLTGIPYGDQAIFVRQTVFAALGGYREIPIMEDVDLMRRLKRRGQRIGVVDAAVTTSARRWLKEGIVFGTLRNWTLMSLYLAGASPHRLARFY